MPRKPIPIEHLPIAAGFKHCFKCSTNKPLDEFYLRLTEYGTHIPCSQCKKCQNLATRQNYQKNIDYYRLQKRSYYAKKRLAKAAA